MSLAAAAGPAAGGPRGTGLALRLALREMRGGLRGFLVFLACLALGVAAIAAIGSVSSAMRDALTREGRAILGGDISFSLVQRPATSAERAFLDREGRVSEVANLSAMARRTDDSDQMLVELKAVDAAYPLAGSLELEEAAGPLPGLLAERDGVFGAVADRDLLLRLGLRPGDRLAVGTTELQVRGIIAREPDRLGDSADLAPRLMISSAGLAATKLIQPGSLVQWLYRLDLTGTGRLPADVEEAAKAEMPEAGWRIRTSADASPGLSESIDRFADFLTLVGLAALLVGGIGIANGVTAYLERKREVIAVLKTVGATGRMVAATYLIQVMILAAAGILLGLALGAATPFAAGALLTGIVPIPLEPGVYPAALAVAAAYGFATALAFALWPIIRARAVPPAALFRDQVAPWRARPRIADIAALLAVGALLIGLAIGLSGSPWFATLFVAAAAAAFVVLRLVALAIMAVARRLPRPRRIVPRLALGNIHRPGALTPTVVLSLGLGLTLLVAISMIDGNLRRELAAGIPAEAPSFFFYGVQQKDMAPLRDLLARDAPDGTVEEVPILRGRIVSLGGVRAEELKPSAEAKWVLSGDRGITWSGTLPAGSRLTEGTWWPAGYDGPPLVSFEEEVARGFGLRVGDTVTVNVLGREVSARIANFRKVEWQSLAINFVMVFSPGSFAGAPYTYLATLTYPGGGTLETEVALLKTVTKAFPTLVVIRVRDALERVAALVAEIGWGVRVAAGLTLLIATLVLGGALAAGQRQRLYEAVILKTLGATRRRLLLAYALEFAVLGAVTAALALVAGSAAAAYVSTAMMEIAFTPLPGVGIAIVALAVALTLGIGLAGTARLLGRKAAPVLRNL